jgi:hypothetical protein
MDDARDGRRPRVAVVVEPAVFELATERHRGDDGRRRMQAGVAQLFFGHKRTLFVVVTEHRFLIAHPVLLGVG